MKPLWKNGSQHKHDLRASETPKESIPSRIFVSSSQDNYVQQVNTKIPHILGKLSKPVYWDFQSIESNPQDHNKYIYNRNR